MSARISKQKVLEILDKRMAHLSQRMDKLEDSCTITEEPGSWRDLDSKRLVLFNALTHRYGALSLVRQEIERLAR